jgi:putative FmdB family regulatory protein
MPIYQYTCEACGNEFELLRRMGDMELATICPKCNHKGCKRRMPTSLTQIHRQGYKRTIPPNPRRPNIVMNNVTIENCGTGIKANGGYIKGNNIRLKGNLVGIDATNTKLEIDKLQIS